MGDRVVTDEVVEIVEYLIAQAKDDTSDGDILRVEETITAHWKGVHGGGEAHCRQQGGGGDGTPRNCSGNGSVVAFADFRKFGAS
jgi:hypothetical protein